MSVTIDQIVQAGLEMADVEKSNNFSTQEKLDRANGAIRDVFDFIVACWQDYFALSAPLTLTSTNTIDLATVVPAVASSATGATIAGIYKELGLTRTQDGFPETIDPLPGYQARNDVRGDGKRRYWLMAQTLSVWPQFNGMNHAGTYVLDYIPQCPTLVTTNTIPAEMERWQDLVSIRAALRFMSKRRQDTSDLKEQRAEKEAAIIQAAGSRKAEVRKLRPIYRHDQTIGFGTIGPYPRR